MKGEKLQQLVIPKLSQWQFFLCHIFVIEQVQALENCEMPNPNILGIYSKLHDSDLNKYHELTQLFRFQLNFINGSIYFANNNLLA